MADCHTKEEVHKKCYLCHIDLIQHYNLNRLNEKVLNIIRKCGKIDIRLPVGVERYLCQKCRRDVGKMEAKFSFIEGVLNKIPENHKENCVSIIIINKEAIEDSIYFFMENKCKQITTLGDECR